MFAIIFMLFINIIIINIAAKHLRVDWRAPRIQKIKIYSFLYHHKEKWSRSVMSDSCNPLDHSLPGSSVHEILQARILEWVAISFCRGSSRPRNQTQVSCIAGRFLTDWAMREAGITTVKMKVAQSCLTLCDPMDIQSREISRPEYWSG